MTDSVLDVLTFLFEHSVDGETPEDSDELRLRLVEAGFSAAVVERAFDWLAALAADDSAPAGAGMRIYAPDELGRLGAECRGRLLFLEQAGVLDATARERVIERVLALDGEECDVERLEWVVLMVLSNRPGHEAAARWMEEFVERRPRADLH